MKQQTPGMSGLWLVSDGESLLVDGLKSLQRSFLKIKLAHIEFQGNVL